MKKLILFLMLWAVTVLGNGTNGLVLVWDHNPVAEGVTNYIVYLGIQSRTNADYSLRFDAGYNDKVILLFLNGNRSENDITYLTNAITGEIATNDYTGVLDFRLPWSSEDFPEVTFFSIKAQNAYTNSFETITNITATATNIFPGYTNIFSHESEFSNELIHERGERPPSKPNGLRILSFNRINLPIIGLGPITNEIFVVESSGDLLEWEKVFEVQVNTNTMPVYLGWWVEGEYLDRRKFWRLIQ